MQYCGIKGYVILCAHLPLIGIFGGEVYRPYAHVYCGIKNYIILGVHIPMIQFYYYF